MDKDEPLLNKISILVAEDDSINQFMITKIPKKNIPIISLSASTMEEEQLAALEAGVNAVVSKPFDLLVLRQKIIALVLKDQMEEVS